MFYPSMTVAVAVNDLTHPKKTLYDKALFFVYTPNVFPDQ